MSSFVQPPGSHVPITLVHPATGMARQPGGGVVVVGTVKGCDSELRVMIFVAKPPAPRPVSRNSVIRSVEIPLTPSNACTAAGIFVPAGKFALVDTRSVS